MHPIRHRYLLCLPPFVFRTHRWRGLCFSRDCSGHAFTVLSVWQVKENKYPAGSSLDFGPALWLCPAKELHSPSPHSSLIFGHCRGTTKSHRRHNLVLSMHVYHCCWLQQEYCRHDQSDFRGSAGSLLLVVGGMRQQMRMDWFQLPWIALPCLFICGTVWIVRYFREKYLLEVLENWRWKLRLSEHRRHQGRSSLKSWKSDSKDTSDQVCEDFWNGGKIEVGFAHQRC